MGINAGQLDRRILVRTPDPGDVREVKDEFGNLGGPPVDTPRWARITSVDVNSRELGPAVVPAGSIVMRLRRDSYTRLVYIGDKIQWDGTWYAIDDISEDLIGETIDFTCSRSDDSPRQRGGEPVPVRPFNEGAILVSLEGIPFVMENGYNIELAGGI